MFREKITEHTAWVKQTLEEYPDIVNIEERTKGSLIDPLLRCLGYDPNDPGQVEREAGIRNKKVDYMLIGEEGVKIAVEAKSAKTVLSQKVIDQLDDYFHRSDAVAGILTNGIYYWLFTDLDKTNVMDSEPYWRVNVRNLTANDIRHLEALARTQVNPAAIHEGAQRERYRTMVNKIVDQELRSPSQELLRMIGKKVGISPLRKAHLKLLAPLVGEAISRNLKGAPPSDPQPRSGTPDHDSPKPLSTISPVPSAAAASVKVSDGKKAHVTLSKFRRATLFDKVLPATSYRQMLLAVVAALQTRHPNDFPERVRSEKDFRGRHWWFISKDLSDLSPKLDRAKVGEYYVNVNFSRRGSVKQAHRFLRAFGYGTTALEIHTYDD